MRAQDVGEAGADGRRLGVGGGGLLADDLADPGRRQLQLRTHLCGAAQGVPGQQEQNVMGQLAVPGGAVARRTPRQPHGAEVRLPLDDNARWAARRHWIFPQRHNRYTHVHIFRVFRDTFNILLFLTRSVVFVQGFFLSIFAINRAF